MAAWSQLLVARYGEKSDGLVTRKDAEVLVSVVVRPEQKLDHAWMVYSALKEEPGDEVGTNHTYLDASDEACSAPGSEAWGFSMMKRLPERRLATSSSL
ncbi:hypothetical protein HU200_064496 [Digitaria exilis]|uniref:Uncharacterized protein n=1 Tax=Digitaria exilis TaxID=1010633 RepID=A0A834ZZJ8_9POAL|nr:hypothetical protein HU200_064496 [Digitaria exilis]